MENNALSQNKLTVAMPLLDTAPWSKNLVKQNCPLQWSVDQYKVTLVELKSMFGQISLHQNLIFSKILNNGVWV